MGAEESNRKRGEPVSFVIRAEHNECLYLIVVLHIYSITL